MIKISADFRQNSLCQKSPNFRYPTVDSNSSYVFWWHKIRLRVNFVRYLLQPMKCSKILCTKTDLQEFIIPKLCACCAPITLGCPPKTVLWPDTLIHHWFACVLLLLFRLSRTNPQSLSYLLTVPIFHSSESNISPNKSICVTIAWVFSAKISFLVQLLLMIFLVINPINLDDIL